MLIRTNYKQYIFTEFINYCWIFHVYVFTNDDQNKFRFKNIY